MTAEFLRVMDSAEHRFEVITIVADFQTALLRLPEADAVLCDGTFQLSPESTCLEKNWDAVRQQAMRRGIHFVLYSGSDRDIACARETNVAALAKPAPISEVYAALTRGKSPNPKALEGTKTKGIGEGDYAESLG